jgi:[CysO sulfur-carrier protein]-S-L-cysteine hydrolase
LSITALRVTDDVLRDVVTFCRAQHPNEACGFIVGTPKTLVGRRVVTMENIHPRPQRNYRMDNDAVVALHHAVDDAGEEIVAVFHSHTDSPPIFSSGHDHKDLEQAHDTGVAYLIVSTRTEHTTARAWRVALPFIGQKVAEEIPLLPTKPGDPLGPAVPVLPWALSIGNQVQIQYRRFRGTGIITMEATITDGDRETVFMTPRLKSGVNSLPIERIAYVQVITESPQAKEVRREAIACLRHAAAALSSGDVNLVEQLIAVPAAAFPATIETSIR